jgi:hypothetical protein
MLHLGRTHDLMHLERRGHAFKRLGPERVAGEISLDEPLRRRTDDHRIGRCQSLEAGCNIRGVTQGELFLPPTSTHLPHHDQASVDPHAHRQADTLPLSEAIVEGVHSLDNI